MEFYVAVQPVPASVEDARILASQHLAPDELALLSPRAVAKRVSEFVAGRVAARRAVSRLLGCEARDSPFLILREGCGPTGCPKVVCSAAHAAPLHVSISHTDGFAVAAAAHGRIGIDLATIQEQAQSFVDETFSPRELRQWGAWLNCDPHSALTITTAFAAKEAALKWLETGFGTALRRVEVMPDTESTSSCPQDPWRVAALLVEVRERSCRRLAAHLARMGESISLLLTEFDVHQFGSLAEGSIQPERSCYYGSFT